MNQVQAAATTHAATRPGIHVRLLGLLLLLLLLLIGAVFSRSCA
jgi:hypothetical protein